ncbi:MAG: threonylcarbamoyl-AMP synthase [Desulfobacteraceae bacterium]|nr:threonylcarbamoyl-AMP synthase [Desulfobacteraceae bacterium]
MKMSHVTWKIERAESVEDLPLSLASMLREGGLVVYPTETFYALGGNPLVPGAVEKIFALKGRDFDKPLPLIASDRRAVVLASLQWPPVAEHLAGLFWPGPLTMVLPASPMLPSSLHAGTGRVAVRISSHPVARLLARAAGGLLTATSANVSGQAPPSTSRAVSKDILDGVDGFADCGDLPGGFPSTIVDVTVHPPVLVRTGAVGWEVIQKAVEALPPA